MSDEEILAGIKEGGIRRELALKYLHDTHMSLIGSFNKKYPMKGIESIKDVYVDSILAVFKNIVSNQYQKTGSLLAYLSIIMSNKCKDLSRAELSQKTQAKKDLEVENNDQRLWVATSELNQEQSIILQEQIRQFKKISSAQGSDCWRILELFFFYGYKMKEIAKELGITSEASARVKKFKCLVKLKQSLARIS